MPKPRQILRIPCPPCTIPISAQPSQNLPSKHQNDVHDRISSLPDTILCHILSFVPTKKAVATPLVLCSSTRYQQCRNRFKEQSSQIFFFQENQVPSDLSGIDYTATFPSGCAALFHLDLFMQNLFGTDFLIQLPLGVFLCNTLVVLKLRGQIVLDFSSPVKLPSLKVLHLIHVYYEDDNSVCSLLSGCPVLAELAIERADFDCVIHYEVSSPTLKNLFLDCSYLDSGFGNILKNTINAPVLEYLSLTDSFCFLYNNLCGEKMTLSELHSVPTRWVAVIGIVEAMRIVKYLHLDYVIMKAFHQNIGSFKKVLIFHNLVELKLKNFCCFWGLLQQLLLKSPHLKHFRLIKICHSNNNHVSKESQCWKPPPRVPDCLLYRHTTFKYEGLEGSEDEMKFIRYVLKNSTILKNVTISTLSRFKSTKV